MLSGARKPLTVFLSKVKRRLIKKPNAHDIESWIIFFLVIAILIVAEKIFI
jgi:hypothetical protein